MRNYKYKLFTGIRRIPLFDYERKIKFRKPFMSEEVMEELFSDDLLIEEKLDGKTEYILLEDKVLYFENLKYIHTIKYDMVPPPLKSSASSFYILFDVYIISQDRWAERREKEEIGINLGYPVAPLIYEGRVEVNEILQFLKLKSLFSKTNQIEGIVLKNYKKRIFGKVIGEEFFNALLAEDFKDYNKRPKIMNSIYKDFDYSKLFKKIV